MTPWIVFAAVVMIAGLGPALVVSGRDKALYRLTGVQLAAPATVLVLIAVSVILGQPSYLIVPLALVLLSFAGTLVYTRLLTE